MLDTKKQLDAQTFWDNRDWDWYKVNIPFFECPDADLTTTYYYRWELLTKHLTYGSPNSGYSFTEFIDRPFWSGAYGAISCPAGHQLYEARWLCHPRFARDYARYWFRTPGAQPRRYSTWLADAVWAVHQVHPDDGFVKDLLPDLIKNYEGWERSYFVPAVGLFWQTGHDDGMEININSRQTKDTVRGAPGYRPTLNSYLWADALAIVRIAELAGDAKTAATYREKAAKLKENLQKKLWDPKRQFFLQRYKQDEERDGFTIKALSLTYETGKYAGNPHGREEIGYVPWQFSLPDTGYEAAWKFLMDKDYFFADYGPTTVERRDPQFLISKTCCVWSGQSWPYATTQTLKAMANLLQGYQQNVVTKADYLKLLQVYAQTHRKHGKPYIAEACHPDTGSWEGHDSYNHSEHYFHSGYVDLIITGLVGLRPRDDDVLEIVPLAPETWDYFTLDNLIYHNLPLTILWDRTGKRYGKGAGLQVFVRDQKVAGIPKLERLTVKLPPVRLGYLAPVNYAVNNDGAYYPRPLASFVNQKAPLAKLNDGNYWYQASPPNRWTCEGSLNARDWCGIDFGTKRRVWYVALYFLDDGRGVVPPEKFDLEYWDGKAWVTATENKREPEKPTGRRANLVSFGHEVRIGSIPPEPAQEPRSKLVPSGEKTQRPAEKLKPLHPIETDKIRAVFTHAKNGVTGLAEFEAWGDERPPVAPAPPPAGNLALNPGGKPFPKASASFTSRFDKVEQANDGVTNFNPAPHNRWTSYESPNVTDWLEIDFGEPKEFARIELAIYDDRGGVQAPARYVVQFWDGKDWRDTANQVRTPAEPVGGQYNEVRFDKVRAPKVRVVFTHKDKARSGVSEIFVWSE